MAIPAFLLIAIIVIAVAFGGRSKRKASLASVFEKVYQLYKTKKCKMRFNAEQLWQNLIRQGWRRVPPQW